jgi:hypothetical protein
MIKIDLNQELKVLTFKGTVSLDRFQQFWQKFTERGLNKGRSRFLNFSKAPLTIKWQVTSSFRLMLKSRQQLMLSD